MTIMYTHTQVPPKEFLEEEWLGMTYTLMNNDLQYKQLAMYHAACLLSNKYKVDIHKFMWNIAKITLDKSVLKEFDTRDIQYHIDT